MKNLNLKILFISFVMFMIFIIEVGDGYVFAEELFTNGNSIIEESNNGLLPEVLDISNGSIKISNNKISQEDNSYSMPENKTITITGNSNEANIQIDSEVGEINLILDNLIINTQNNFDKNSDINNLPSYENVTPINIGTGNNANVELVNNNNLKGLCAIYAYNNSNINISGTGSLLVQGTSGRSIYSKGGNITISSGNILSNSSSIFAGTNSEAKIGDIYILGGNIQITGGDKYQALAAHAEGNSNYTAGNIYISDGNILAKSMNGASAIYVKSDLAISGGTIVASIEAGESSDAAIKAQNVTISGGTITAKSNINNGVGIGSWEDINISSNNKHMPTHIVAEGNFMGIFAFADLNIESGEIYAYGNKNALAAQKLINISGEKYKFYESDTNEFSTAKSVDSILNSENNKSNCKYIAMKEDSLFKNNIVVISIAIILILLFVIVFIYIKTKSFRKTKNK